MSFVWKSKAWRTRRSLLRTRSMRVLACAAGFSTLLVGSIAPMADPAAAAKAPLTLPGELTLVAAVPHSSVVWVVGEEAAPHSSWLVGRWDKGRWQRMPAPKVGPYGMITSIAAAPGGALWLGADVQEGAANNPNGVGVIWRWNGHEIRGSVQGRQLRCALRRPGCVDLGQFRHKRLGSHELPRGRSTGTAGSGLRCRRLQYEHLPAGNSSFRRESLVGGPCGSGPLRRAALRLDGWKLSLGCLQHGDASVFCHSFGRAGVDNPDDRPTRGPCRCQRRERQRGLCRGVHLRARRVRGPSSRGATGDPGRYWRPTSELPVPATELATSYVPTNTLPPPVTITHNFVDGQLIASG